MRDKIKEWCEWIIAIVAIITGWYFIQKYIFGKTDEEKQILDDIKTNDEKIKQKQEEVNEYEKQEKEIQKQVDKVKEDIDNKFSDIDDYNKKAEEEK